MKWKQSMKNLLREKGYLLAFAVCLTAVIVSGWLFVRSLNSTDDELALPDAVEAAVLPSLSADRNARRDPLESPVQQNRPVTPAIPETEPAPETAGKTGDAGAGPGKVRFRPVEGDVVRGYSMEKLAYNPTTRDWRTHAGTDLAAPEGSEVRAAADGTVLAVFADDLLGQTVVLEHAGGWVTQYANLAEEVAVSAGDRVTAGQTVGTVGKTALAEVGSEPHLHFAVYKNNVPQDPELFLAGS